MIKAVGQGKDGNAVLLLGLSGENITRLVAGEPIHITPDQMMQLGFPAMHVGIVYGKTEEEIVKQMKKPT